MWQSQYRNNFNSIFLMKGGEIMGKAVKVKKRKKKKKEGCK